MLPSNKYPACIFATSFHECECNKTTVFVIVKSVNSKICHCYFIVMSSRHHTCYCFFCCTIFPCIVLQRFLHVAHVQLQMFVFRITHNIIYSVSYTSYVNYVYSNLFVLDRVHIPLYGITALYCFMQPGTSSAVARRRGGGLRCLSGFNRI